jgi:hypothetical protein
MESFILSSEMTMEVAGVMQIRKMKQTALMMILTIGQKVTGQAGWDILIGNNCFVLLTHSTLVMCFIY